MSQNHASQADALARVDLSQSSSERVQIRSEIREMTEKISKEHLSISHLKKLNKINERVKNTREAALESMALRVFTERSAKRVLANCKSAVPWKDAKMVKEMVVAYIESNKWKALGKLAGKRMRYASAPRFMYGPLGMDTARKARVIQQRKKRDDGPVTKALNKLDETQEKLQDMSDVRVLELFNILVELEKSAGDGFKGVCLFQLCLDPKSFAQSVENLFHLACLIKQQKAEIEADEDTGLPRVYVADEQKRPDENDYVAEDDDKPLQQGILNLTYSEWQDAIKTFNIQKSLIPHRAHHNEA